MTSSSAALAVPRQEEGQVERRQRCWIKRARYDGGRLIVNEFHCGLWRCTWCRAHLEEFAVERYRPKEPLIVERHVVDRDRLRAFTTRINRHGGGYVQIPAPDDKCVLLIHGCEFGGEAVDAELALIDAFRARPPGRQTVRAGATKIWMSLVTGMSDAEENDELEAGPAEVEIPAFDAWRLEDDPPSREPGTDLGVIRKPWSEISAILHRHGLNPRTLRRPDGSITLVSDFPTPDTWDFIILQSELLAHDAAAPPLSAGADSAS